MTGTRKLPDGQITSDFQKSCQAPFAKIFLFSFEANQFSDSYCPVPIEGRCATSSTWSGMRWTRTARETSADCLRTVKSCGSDAPILGVKPVRRSAGDGVKQRGHRGEREVSRKTIARGMPGRSGVTVVTMLVCFFHLHARPRARLAPGIPCALCFLRANDFAKPRTHRAAGSRGHI